MIRRSITFAALAVCSLVQSAYAQTPVITAPASGSVFRAGPDFATDVLHDPWDFNNYEDISPNPDEFHGWATSPAHAWTIYGPGPAFISQGQFRGTASGDNQLALLYRGDAIGLNPGRTGRTYPIDTSKYRKLAIKISYSNAPGSPSTGYGRAVAYWYHGSAGEPNTLNRTGGAVIPEEARNGTSIFVLDLSTVTSASGLVDGGGTTAAPWTNEPYVKGLRIDPSNLHDTQNISIDWVRLTASDHQSSATLLPISLAGCSGPSTVTVTDAAGDSVVVVKNGIASPTFNYGILPPGTYSMRASCGSSAASAPVSFTINSPPAVTVIDPDETGDPATDYAFTQSGGANRWDFEQFSDIATGGNVSITDGACASGGCGLIPSPRGGHMFRGSSIGTQPGQLGDPAIEFLNGTVNPVSSRRHRYLTFSLRINRPFSTAEGSVARLYWGSATYSDATTGTTSQDMRVWPGLHTYTIDLGALTLENGGIEHECLPYCPTTPWPTRSIRFFRIDPHEFGDVPTSFDLDDVSLNAPDEVNLNGSGPGSSFVIRWAVADSDSSGSTYSTRIYYDTDQNPSSKTALTGALPTALGQNQYQWTPPANFAPGTYWIYIETTETRGGISEVRGAYSTGPIVVYSIGATSPQITVSTPVAGQKVPFPFTIEGCAFDQGDASGINMDEVAVFATAGQGVVGVPAGTTFALGYGSGLGALEYAPLTPNTPVVCPSVSNTASPFRMAGFRVRDVGLPQGPWTLRVLGRSTISGKLTPLASDIAITSSQHPLPPVNFQLTASGNTVTLSFEAPTGGLPIGGYIIDISRNAEFTAIVANIVVPGPGSYSGPMANGTWYFKVFSTHLSGARGESTEVKSITLPAGGPPPASQPGAPVLTATQMTSNPIVLSWTPGPGGTPSSYTLFAGTTPGGSDLGAFPMGTATSIAANAPLGLRVHVRVQAQNSGGSAMSNEITLLVPNPSAPGAPALNPATVSGGHVTLSWAPGPGGAPAGYTLLARFSPAGAAAISVPVSGTSLTVPAPPGTYYVTVVATSAAGSSPESNQITLVVP